MLKFGCLVDLAAKLPPGTMLLNRDAASGGVCEQGPADRCRLSGTKQQWLTRRAERRAGPTESDQAKQIEKEEEEENGGMPRKEEPWLPSANHEY